MNKKKKKHTHLNTEYTSKLTFLVLSPCSLNDKQATKYANLSSVFYSKQLSMIRGNMKNVKELKTDTVFDSAVMYFFFFFAVKMISNQK